MMIFRLIPSPRFVASVAVILPVFLLAPVGWAQEKSCDDEKPASTEAETGSDGEELVSQTDHSIVIGGEPVDYTAKAGTIQLSNAKGEKTASVFYIAYSRKLKEDDPGQRPLVFSFNGGPGSSSVWLHLGALGPRIVVFPDKGTTTPKPPFALVDNVHSLLDVADLVFIDPVSTGFSRAEKPDGAGQFHGLDEDIRSVGDFIRLYTTRHDRWSSPKFLIGESYGAVRASGLASHLQERYGMYLNGVMIVSGLLDFSTLRPASNNDLPYILFLPSMFATAHFHGVLDPDLREDFSKTLAEVEDFAQGEYATALFRGNTLSEAVRSAVRRKTARYIGLSEEFVEKSNLRVTPSAYRKELLRAQMKTVGRFDSRVVGRDTNHAGQYPEYDPSYFVVLGSFASAINDYLRRELEFESDLPYEILTGLPWKYPRDSGYVSVSGRLADSMRKNPHLKVHVACGYYDLATPHFAILHSLNRMDIAPALRANITVDYYEGGHMMYTNPKALAKLKTDLEQFIGTAVE